MNRIYLDYAATTPVAREVLEEMLPYLKKEYGNASSIHQAGQTSRAAIDKAREILADFLNCSLFEVIFTGSATESDNIAILGVADFYLRKNDIHPALKGRVSCQSSRKNIISQAVQPCAEAQDVLRLGDKKIHIITSKIEHPAVLESCRVLEKWGCEVDYCQVNKEGLVETEKIEKLIKDNTVLISVMYANNEIGAVQPILKIGKMIQRVNQTREQKIYFHTDAVQAVNYLNCDVRELGVDLLTLSGHKIYGPKGVGALYVKQGTEIESIMYGGHQESSLRPGTENTANIVGLGKAIEMVKELKSQNSGILKYRDKLINGILTKIPNSRLNGSKDHRLPNNINVSFDGAEGEALVMALDQEGIAASTGSACSSGSLDPSHVLLALGLNHAQAHGSLRMTLGRQTTEKEIDKVLDVLPKVVKRLREISGFKTT